MARDSVLGTGAASHDRIRIDETADQRFRLPMAMIVSLALHGGFAGWLTQSMLLPTWASQGDAPRMEARLSAPPVSSYGEAVVPTQLVEMPARRPVANTALVPVAQADVASDQVEVAASASQLAAAESDLRPPVVAEAWPSADVRDFYIPTPFLDSSPVPELPIVIMPGNDLLWDARKGSVVLVLYVGETGNVDFVDTEDHDLPAALTVLAVDAFRGAKMLPATKNGQPAKAKMKILVEIHQSPVLSTS